MITPQQIEIARKALCELRKSAIRGHLVQLQQELGELPSGSEAGIERRMLKACADCRECRDQALAVVEALEAMQVLQS